IEAPLRMKMRSTMPREAPIVRRIAMSRPLSFTIMIIPEMMLKAATRMISARIRNITLRSISTALTMLELACCQSTIRTWPPSPALAEGDPVIVELGKRTGDNVPGDQRAAADVVRADATDDRARGGAALAGGHDLTFDHRRGANDTRHLPNLGRDRVEIGQHP